MKNLNKAGLLITFLFCVLVFSACGAKKSTDVSVEDVFPKDTSMVLALDYSSQDQAKEFDALLAKFPDVGLGKLFLQGFNMAATKDGFSWENDIAPMFEGEWKAAFSMIIPENVKLSEDFKSLDPQDLNIYFAGKFENSDAVRDFIERMIGEKIDTWAGVKHEEKDGVDYWTKDGASFYLVGYGDLFFITVSQKNVDEAISRIENGGGFNENQEYLLKTNSLAKNNLGYIYVNGKTFTDYYGEKFSKVFSGTPLNDQLKSMGDVFLFWTAEKDGIRLVSSTDLNSDAKIEDFITDPNYKLSLINKVNGEGVFLYAENSGFGKNLEYFIDGFEAGFNQSLEETVESSSGENVDFSIDPKSLQTAILSEVSEPLGSQPFGVVDEPEVVNAIESSSSMRAVVNGIVAKIKEFLVKIDVLLKSPVAFVMSDAGGYIPTASLYFQLTENDKEKAKELLISLDTYVDEIIEAMNQDLASLDSVENSGLIKKEIEAVDGGGLHKLYFDWNALPDVDKADFEKAFGTLDSLKLEVYYGLTGDNVFVIAFYPDFPKSFGKNVLAENKDYLAAVKKLRETYGSNVSYFRMKPLLDIIDRFVVLAGERGELSELEMSLYETKFKAFLSPLNFFISSAVFENNSVNETMFVGIGE